MKTDKCAFATHHIATFIVCVSALTCGALLAGGCSNNSTAWPQPDGRTGDGGHVDRPRKDVDRPRKDVDRPRKDACVPNCHWDCFGGHLCVNGTVYEAFYWPAPCCNYNDPWPAPGPICTDGIVAAKCSAGTTCSNNGQAIDARYKACILKTRQGYVANPASEELMRLLCTGSDPKLAGMGCTTDSDCRPAAASIAGALACDATSKQCVATARPAAPTDYGTSCGLPPTSVSSFSEALMQVASPTGATFLCHAITDTANNCVRQARTYACSFDEDCPTGSICLCGTFSGGPNSQRGGTFCAASTNRTTVAGRTAGLMCP